MKKFLTIIFLLFLSNVAIAAYRIQTKTSHCTASVLPDPACSPGAVLTTDVRTICKVGYTKTVRNVSVTTKKKVFQEYSIPWSAHSNYEVDHIISLELGGSNDISNLFPESYLIKNGARVKDVFENYLHKQVCNGSTTITEAQSEISSNWLTYYTEILNPVKTSITKPSSVNSQVIPPSVSSVPISATPISGPAI